MTAKPRADLVALLLQFEMCAAGMSSLYLSTADAEPAVAAWVEMRGHRVQVEQLTRARDGKLIAWTHWTVTSATGQDWTVTCSLHDDHEVTEPPAQADQAVLARVQAALNGDPPEVSDEVFAAETSPPEAPTMDELGRGCDLRGAP